MRKFVIKCKRTDLYFVDFYYAHSGTQPQGRKCVEFSSKAAVLDKMDVADLILEIQATAQHSQPVAYELIEV